MYLLGDACIYLFVHALLLAFEAEKFGEVQSWDLETFPPSQTVLLGGLQLLYAF